MNITLLGHHDIASMYALDRVIRLLPEQQFSVRLSGAAETASSGAEPLDELMQADRKLCERFLAGELIGPVAAPLHGGSVVPLEAPNAPEGLADLADLDPDLIVSIRYRRILRDDAIGIPRIGVLNLHSGILPDYKGVMATFWALLHGELEIGTTLHWIVDAGIDTGPVIGICRQPARPDRSYLANVLGLYPAGCDLLVGAIRALAAGANLPTKNQSGAGRYFHAPDGAAIERFERTGMRLVGAADAAGISAQR